MEYSVGLPKNVSYIDFRPNMPSSLAWLLTGRTVTHLEAEVHGTGQTVVLYRLCY
jgi:hypothetical protein